ncbi:MAG: DJ-1/PfpI family protein [Nitrospinales bacterium]
MGRLDKKNILVVIPKDYYNEEELETCLKVFEEEGARTLVASAKLKEAVGMKTGRFRPDVLIVDAVEGIMGDSYVTEAGHGTRQVKGIFHGVVLIGGQGARKYLWPDKVLHLLLADRHRSGFVVSAIGTAVPCLGHTGLLEGKTVAAEKNKHTLPELEKEKITIGEQDVVADDRIITANGAAAAERFAQAVVEAVQQTKFK